MSTLGNSFWHVLNYFPHEGDAFWGILGKSWETSGKMCLPRLGKPLGKFWVNRITQMDVDSG